MTTTTAPPSLSRFRSAQDKQWRRIAHELATGRKESHWMWFVFPKLRKLARSETADYYGLRGREEALAYLDDPTLRMRLAESTMAILRHPRLMFDRTDANRLLSSMTLFRELVSDPTLPDAVIQKFYGGRACQLTLDVLAGRPIPVQWTPAPKRPWSIPAARRGSWSGSAQGRVEVGHHWEKQIKKARAAVEAAGQATLWRDREPMSHREIESFLKGFGLSPAATRQIVDRWVDDQNLANQQGWDQRAEEGDPDCTCQ